MIIFIFLQLAVGSVNDGLHGNSDCDFAQHSHSPISTTYTQAKKVARLEYDVDRILQLTRMERFPFLVNIRYVMRKSVNKFTPIANVQMRCVFVQV